jgi:phosphoribosylaminoimidazole synthetase
MDYKAAGVDISAADLAKDKIKSLARSTFNAGVLSEIGAFGGMFRPDLGRYQEPVLVASTDGVGTKIRVAVMAGVHDSVGYDLVAHCVNDILVQGAVPLFFLDYIALGKMDPEKVAAIVSGFARACSEFGCPLIGGETAEMPASSSESWTARAPCPRAFEPATCCSACPRRGSTRTATRLRERCSSRRSDIRSTLTWPNWARRSARRS